jgi:hypothetical protein
MGASHRTIAVIVPVQAVEVATVVEGGFIVAQDMVGQVRDRFLGYVFHSGLIKGLFVYLLCAG